MTCTFPVWRILLRSMVRRFINNTADVLGGAINHVGAKSDRLAITGSTFTGNAAGEHRNIMCTTPVECTLSILGVATVSLSLSRVATWLLACSLTAVTCVVRRVQGRRNIRGWYRKRHGGRHDISGQQHAAERGDRR